MSIQNMVLGELLQRQGYAYGYELREQLLQLSEALGYSDTVVYSALDALEKKGFVRAVNRGELVVGGRKEGSRVYYEVTDAGVKGYSSWMLSIPDKAPLRESLHMQIMSAKAEDVPHLIEALVDFEDQSRAQLHYLMVRPLGSRSIHGRMVGAALVQDALVAHLQTMMEWAQRSRRALTTLVEHPTGVPGRRRP